MTQTQHALVPSNTIQFHNHQLILLDIDGTQCVAIKPICEAIGLHWGSQFNRIMRDDVLSSTIFITNTVAEDGKAREMVCLPINYLNGWLFGINTARVKPELRDTITLYKRECYQVLHDYWMHGQASQSRSGEPIFHVTATELAKLVDRELEQKLPSALTPSEAFSLHAFFIQLRQIHAAWQTLAPALRQLESPIHRRYVNIFQDYKLNLLNLKRIETIAANQYHHRNQPLDH